MVGAQKPLFEGLRVAAFRKGAKFTISSLKALKWPYEKGTEHLIVICRRNRYLPAAITFGLRYVFNRALIERCLAACKYPITLLVSGDEGFRRY
jgi:hypothetical protein